MAKHRRQWCNESYLYYTSQESIISFLSLLNKKLFLSYVCVGSQKKNLGFCINH